MVEADEADLSAVFFLSLYTTVLFPYTLYKLFVQGGDSNQVVKPWIQVSSCASLRVHRRALSMHHRSSEAGGAQRHAWGLAGNAKGGRFQQSQALPV